MKRTRWIGILLGVIGLLVTGCGGGEKIPPLTPTTFGSFGSKITISVPFKMEKEPFNLPENVRAMISGYEYYSGDSKIIGISITEALYNKNAAPADWKPSLEGAADGSINSVEKIAGVKNLSSSKEPANVSGRPAIITTMVYENSKAIRVEQKGLVVVDGYATWGITLLYAQNNETAKNLANQVLKSVLITN